MLKKLSINNYILINSLDMEFGDGFTAITGETGAGKSILVGALSLILGQRADTDVLLNKDEKCVIEGLFSVKSYGLEGFFNENDLDYEESCLLRREINKQGKSRAFINDTPVNLPVLKILGERLVDIHSQHQTLMLNTSGFQMAILDNYAGNALRLEEYRNAYGDYSSMKAELDALLDKESELRTEEDYLKFQYAELEAAALSADEYGILEDELKVLGNAEEIKAKLFSVNQLLASSENNLLDKLQQIIGETGRLTEFHAGLADLHNRLNSLGIELSDISSGLERIEESVQYDPQRLEVATARLDMINSLLQKHKVQDINNLLDKQSEIDDKLQKITSLDDEIERLKKMSENAKADSTNLAQELAKSRRAVIKDIESEITATLRELGMKDAVLKIDIKALEVFTRSGMDEVAFSFSANKGSSPAPVSKIASGGELSRLMLALKSMITRKSLLPTIILDEIDMGVSGDIAGKVARLLQKMSDNLQLIAITHLPQIAGRAGEQFRVFKKYSDNRTVSGVKRLSDSERIEEIAAMLSDGKPSDAALTTAKELLDKN
jgi:DNA repair protein RecN (Recombination protein N)